MKLNYNIYENYSGGKPEEEKLLAEQMILVQVRKEYEQPERIVIRPKAKVWKDILLLLAVLTALISVLIIMHSSLPIKAGIFVMVCILSGLAYFAVLCRKLLLTLITIYQKYAPGFVRSACLFEPCCSEYMRRSVLKYGAVKGFIKGIKRILRCRYPNGGVDEP